MRLFMVGGAVRDKLLGNEPKDKDWVIVGASEEDITKLEAEGFKLVGNDFPVYLHPDTGEEYALARRERKVGNGYNGFKMETRPGNLNSELMKKFIDMGFKKDKDYPINVLLKAFRRINR